ncbi:MAG: hypothetical protein KC978_19485, partial [Candidatus Omnitrophica bacterium]|nr:hypothetical protein [Candidatus Omnitrophota bacterium]
MKMTDEFTLNKIVQIVTTYKLPEGEFSPEGSWENVYARYSLKDDRIHHEADVTIAREPNPDGTATLTVSSARETVESYRFFVDVRMTLEANAISSPLQWEQKSKLAKNREEPGRSNSELSTRAVFENEIMRVTENGTQRSLGLTGPVSQRWALIDAVQRLDEDEEESFEFTWFDEMPQAYAGHRLQSLGTTTASLAGTDHRLAGWQQTGDGIAPTVYWR